MGNCASKFKVAAVAIRVFKNEASKRPAEQLGHWKMVSDDIGIEEPKLIRLANPNPLIPRLNFEGLEHLLPEGMMKASFLQKSGVTNAMENFLMEEEKNVNQNLERLINRTLDPEVIRTLEKLKNRPSDTEVPTQNLGNPQKPVLSTMSKEEFQLKLKNWMSGTEVIQNLHNPQKVSSILSNQERLDQIKTMASNMTSTQERLDQIKTMASNMSMDEIRAVGDQIKNMASNMSMDEIRAVSTKGTGKPVGPNRTMGPSSLNEGCMDQLAETMASNISLNENMGVNTGGARGPPVGAEETGVWCNGVWFPTFGEPIEELDDFINPSMDENQESNGSMETFLKNRASELNQHFNPRKVSLTLPTQNTKGKDKIAEPTTSSMSMGPKKAIKKTKNVAMAGILRQAAKRNPSAGVENRANRSGGTSGAAGAKGTGIIQDINPRKISSTLSIQERLDQIKTMSSNMSMDENRTVVTEGTRGSGGSIGILRQAETRAPGASVENKAVGPGTASAAEFAKMVKATPDFGLHLRLRDGD